MGIKYGGRGTASSEPVRVYCGYGLLLCYSSWSGRSSLFLINVGSGYLIKNIPESENPIYTITKVDEYTFDITTNGTQTFGYIIAG